MRATFCNMRVLGVMNMISVHTAATVCQNKTPNSVIKLTDLTR